MGMTDQPTDQPIDRPTDRLTAANRPRPAAWTRRQVLTTMSAAAASALAVGLLAACSSDDDTSGATDDPATTEPASAGPVPGMSIASFDNASDRPSPVMVGISDIDGNVASFGSVDLRITPTGSGDIPPIWSGPADFLPLPGRPAGGPSATPRWGAPSEGVGVYRTEPLRLLPGFYEVAATATTDRGPLRVSTGLEVLTRSRVLVPGQQAPRTRNPVIGTPGVAPSAIDSRATTADDLDPRIHTTVIADALEAGRRMVVAVTTPVYCQSKFCGPITDVVADLAPAYPATAFVHLEVWENYESQTISPFAAEWIWPDRDAARGANEPWVFLVGTDGMITHRWGNVLDLAELTALLVS